MTVKLERIWFYAGLTSLISVIAILIFFSDRGLGFPDEGLHALLSNPLQENRNSLVNYDILFKYLYDSSGITLNLIELRLFRLSLVILGSLYLITPVYLLNKSNINNIISPRLFFVIALLLGFWNYLTWFTRTPSYGSFTFLGIQLFLGSLLFFQSKYISIPSIRTLIFSIICLFGFILCWISKISAIPVLVFILIITSFILPKKSIIWYSLFIVIFVAGFISFYYFYDYININLFNNVKDALFQKSSTHSLDSQLKNLGTSLVLFFSAFLFGLLLFKKIIYIKRKKLILFSTLFLILVILFILLDFHRSKMTHLNRVNFIGEYLIHRMSMIIILILAFFTGLKLNFNNSKNNLIGLFIFNLAILASVLGTNSSLLFASIGSIQFLILGWMMILKFEKAILILFIPITFLIFTIPIFFHIPPGQGKWINATHKYYYGKNKYDYVYLDKETFLVQSKVKEILEKDSINYILGYDRLPGFIYLSGYTYTSPGSYLWGNEDIDMYFRKKFTNPNSLQLILNGKESQEIMFPYLNKYTLTLKDSVGVYLPHRFKGSTQFYIFKCIKKN